MEEKIVGSGSRGVKVVEAAEAKVVMEKNVSNESMRHGRIRKMYLEE